MSLWQSKRQEARVKRVWAILRFFTQFGFIVFTYLQQNSGVKLALCIEILYLKMI
ncbi:MAG: hypothetical protein HEQ20_00960 [Aphanizomenon flos-aquae KM1D3_PB]|uniref:hypothetical protein n=1 Tax=Aphanizomenon flos-aquae TaxID=1176 RepID=UPI000AE9123C|nr:hypothetical protein [Aphanizomenon flos-aquae]QSV69574.1 MAG: hypothetical protein HEQ20_00960 [Aphanizomenon flos-aquae KM1D3_PB]